MKFVCSGGLNGSGYKCTFSNPLFPFTYYSPTETIDCGYFELFSQSYPIKGKYSEWQKFGCNLDVTTLRAFKLKIQDSEYVIITSIAESNGKGTRDVFLQLFDVSRNQPITHPLWSIYASHLSFGDYNNDGRLDFLETRYERKANDDDTFRTTFKTLSDRHVF